MGGSRINSCTDLVGLPAVDEGRTLNRSRQASDPASNIITRDPSQNFLCYRKSQACHLTENKN